MRDLQGNNFLAFVGSDGACGNATAGSARLYAARADLDATGPWIVSDPAPLSLPNGTAPCQWHVRPAVDPVTGRLWHFVGTCAAPGAQPSSVLVSEWAVGAGSGAPPTWARSCAFDAVSPGLVFAGYDVRVFAGGTTPGEVVPPCTLVPVSTLDVVANASIMFTADAGADPALPPLLLCSRNMHTFPASKLELTALSPVTGALLWRVNVSVGGDATSWSSVAVFDRRFVALGIDGGRFSYSICMHGWAANSSATASELMYNILPEQKDPYTAPVTAAMMMWAPAAAAGGDWPIMLAHLGAESYPIITRSDGCRPGNVTAASPAYVFNFTRAEFFANRTAFPVAACPLGASQTCAYLSYAHGRPLVATMVGQAYNYWFGGGDDDA